MIEHIPELVEAGIDSLKIEGRMKTALYVATVARTYRKAIDDYFADPELYEKKIWTGIRQRSPSAPIVSLRRGSISASRMKIRRSMIITLT